MAAARDEYRDRLFNFLFGSSEHKEWTLIRLPVPKLVVFYNGTDEQPDESVLCLSDAFDENRRADADIQVRVRMVNINQGHSAQIMRACEPLREYAEFIFRVQELEAAMSLQSAIDQAIEEMPETFAIKRYLEAHKSEVKEMLTTEYNEKKQMELFYEDGRQEGRQEGIQAGEKRFSRLMSILFAVNRSNDAMRALNDTEYRQKLYEEFRIA